MKKKISVVTPCYNEEGNIEDIYLQVKNVFNGLDSYEYEHIFIDNDSQDKTLSILRNIAQKDPHVKIIVNAKNVGAVRSIYYVMQQAYGEAVILIYADLQEPPELIVDFLQKWEEGYKTVLAVRVASKENFFLFRIKKLYYYVLGKISDVDIGKEAANGFGLYDKKVIDVLRSINDPSPYFKGIISEIGFESCKIEYKHNVRKRGISSASLYNLYDHAMLGITSYSIVPLRLATILGFLLSFLSFIVVICILVVKLMFWNYFPAGIATIIIGVFFMFSILLFFIGILGEYIGLINKRLLKRPLVIERERINFE